MNLSSGELMPIIRSALERGQRVRMTVNGSSMVPFIHDNDTVELEPLCSLPRFGDIVLALGANGHYVAHRVVQVKGEGIYLRGDAQTHCEGPLMFENILGKVIQSEHHGKIRCHTRGFWRILGQIWGSTHPVGFDVEHVKNIDIEICLDT